LDATRRAKGRDMFCLERRRGPGLAAHCRRTMHIGVAGGLVRKRNRGRVGHAEGCGPAVRRRKMVGPKEIVLFLN
jgi:hypothetical protein